MNGPPPPSAFPRGHHGQVLSLQHRPSVQNIYLNRMECLQVLSLKCLSTSPVAPLPPPALWGCDSQALGTVTTAGPVDNGQRLLSHLPPSWLPNPTLPKAAGSEFPNRAGHRAQQHGPQLHGREGSPARGCGPFSWTEPLGAVHCVRYRALRGSTCRCAERNLRNPSTEPRVCPWPASQVGPPKIRTRVVSSRHSRQAFHPWPSHSFQTGRRETQFSLHTILNLLQ